MEKNEDKKLTPQECLGIVKNMEEDRKKLLSWLQRLQADFDNFRRRAREEKEENVYREKAKFFEKLLPIIDNLERALEAGKEEKSEDSFYKGVEMIYQGLIQTLKIEGLEPTNSVGCHFDPEKHEALMQVDACEEYGDNVIVEELQKGYYFNNRTLRPAKVKVAKTKNKGGMQ